MDMFNPEYRENRESMFESRKLTKKVESEIRRTLEQKKEKFSDLVMCPVKSCGTPVTVKIKQQEALLTCPNCGWKMVVKYTQLK